MNRKLTITLYWFKAVTPALVVILGAGVFFRKAVADSILSTPHPELVYLIFGGFFIGLLLSWLALFHYVREESLLEKWRMTPEDARHDLLARTTWEPMFAPLYDLLSGRANIPLRMRQAAVETELQAAEGNIGSRLILPTYIGGALIGLGLVGTFIGLLGTLEELGTLFSSLMNTGSKTASSSELFGQMLQRMQAPLRGMGTAFVASLYGLLGSLLLGLVVLAVRKTGDAVIDRVRQSVRDVDYGAGSNLGTALALDADMAWAESERWRAMFEDMNQRHKELLGTHRDMQETMHQDVLGLVEGSRLVHQAMSARNSIDAHLQRALGEGAHWMQAWDQIHAEIKQQRAEAQTHMHTISHVMERQNELLRGLLASAVRTESLLVQSGQEQSEALRDNAIDSQALVASLQACRYSFEDAASKLRMNLALQSHQDSDAFA
jgi:hypothetical protein